MKKSLLLLALLAPTSLFSQSRTLLSPYVAADGSVTGSPVMLGANLTRESGWLAVRAGGALDARTLFGSSSATSAYGTAYAADLDGLLFAGSPTAEHVVPFAVAGVGARLMRPGSGTEAALSWSYGAGARMPVTPWLSMEGELRHSEPFTGPAADLGGALGAGWAVRFGASVRVSGGRRVAPVAPAPVPLDLPRADAGAATSSVAAAAVAARALDTADNYLGTRYKWGGNTPAEGFDCSGFVKFVYARQGIELPRVSRDQARTGEALPLEVSAFRPGDLLAFASKRGGTVDHIAIYAGNNRIIHASASGRGVRFDDLGTSRGSWYLEHMVAARRVIGQPLLAGLR
jgi:hypothetical protein